jgi:hypothetical protein
MGAAFVPRDRTVIVVVALCAVNTRELRRVRIHRNIFQFHVATNAVKPRMDTGLIPRRVHIERDRASLALYAKPLASVASKAIVVVLCNHATYVDSRR